MILRITNFFLLKKVLARTRTSRYFVDLQVNPRNWVNYKGLMKSQLAIDLVIGNEWQVHPPVIIYFI